MLSKQTVFILGAGASAPYGLPVGSVLGQNICGPGQARYLFSTFGSVTPKGFTDAHAKLFVETFKGSLQPSIDAFLERQTDRQGGLSNIEQPGGPGYNFRITATEART